ncbi:MAG TPA: hypothetical protein VM684_20990 [Gaiellales bacterium]|nr:hypothetical protein [Gaiellales bacterium]
MTRATTIAPPERQLSDQPYRLSAVLALLGAVLLAVGTWMHPAHADAGVPTEAFAEYAADSRAAWVAAHLLQFGGITGMTLATVLLARAVAGPRGSAWARVTTVCATAGLATAAVLQAVDGVALKAMVDLWSGAEEDRSKLFAAALTVRSIEIGLDALFALVFAAAFLTFGFGLLTAPAGSKGLGALAVVAAGVGAVNGGTLAVSGFSTATMFVTMVSGPLTLVWLLLAAAWSWRRATLPASSAAHS